TRNRRAKSHHGVPIHTESRIARPNRPSPSSRNNRRGVPVTADVSGAAIEGSFFSLPEGEGGEARSAEPGWGADHLKAPHPLTPPHHLLRSRGRGTHPLASRNRSARFGAGVCYLLCRPWTY